MTDIDIHALAAQRKEIVIIWSVEDVKEVRPDLDDDQCWHVLQEAEVGHDAGYGISWETLKATADHFYPYKFDE